VLANWIQPVVPDAGVRVVKSAVQEGKTYWVITVPRAPRPRMPSRLRATTTTSACTFGTAAADAGSGDKFGHSRAPPICPRQVDLHLRRCHDITSRPAG
jgi:hypothetical protein